MKTSEFRVWLANLVRLSRGQREEVEQALGHPVSHPPPLEWLERAHAGDISCPQCEAHKPYRWGRQGGPAAISLPPVRAYLYAAVRNAAVAVTTQGSVVDLQSSADRGLNRPRGGPSLRYP